MGTVSNTFDRVTKSLNLPATLDALEKPVKLPPSLLAKARETREHDTPSSIDRFLEVIGELSSQNTHILEEVTRQTSYPEYWKASHAAHRRLESSTTRRKKTRISGRTTSYSDRSPTKPILVLL